MYIEKQKPFHKSTCRCHVCMEWFVLRSQELGYKIEILEGQKYALQQEFNRILETIKTDAEHDGCIYRAAICLNDTYCTLDVYKGVLHSCGRGSDLDKECTNKVDPVCLTNTRK
jgi:hypothetical protein